MKEKNLRIFFILGLSISFVLMLILMIFGNITLNLTAIIFFYAVKFLSGFGLILSIANGFLILLDQASEKLDIVIILQIFVPFVFIGYAIYLVISSYFRNTLFSPGGFWLVIDISMYFYGILSLLLTLYLFPLMKDKFYKGIELSKFSAFKNGAKGAARKVKKKFFTLKGDYAKVQKQDQLTVKDLLESWRIKFAINFLLVIAIIGIFALVAPFINLPFYTSIAPFIWTINLFYLFGISFASYILIKKLLSLQGVTLQKLKIKKKDRQIEKLEREKEELKKQLESHE